MRLWITFSLAFFSFALGLCRFQGAVAHESSYAQQKQQQAKAQDKKSQPGNQSRPDSKLQQDSQPQDTIGGEFISSLYYNLKNMEGVLHNITQLAQFFEKYKAPTGPFVATPEELRQDFKALTFEVQRRIKNQAPAIDATEAQKGQAEFKATLQDAIQEIMKDSHKGRRYALTLKAVWQDKLADNLFRAIRHNYAERVGDYARILTNKNLSTWTDEKGQIALHQIITHARSEEQALAMARELLPFSRTSLWVHEDVKGRTALHLAALKNWPVLIRYLAEQTWKELRAVSTATGGHATGGHATGGHATGGAVSDAASSEASAKSRGDFTTAELAAQQKSTMRDKTTDEFIKAQMRKWLDAPDDEGFTAVQLAALQGHKDVAWLLLFTYKSSLHTSTWPVDTRAAPGVANRKNLRLSFLFKEPKFLDVIEFLLQKGVDFNDVPYYYLTWPKQIESDIEKARDREQIASNWASLDAFVKSAVTRRHTYVLKKLSQKLEKMIPVGGEQSKGPVVDEHYVNLPGGVDTLVGDEDPVIYARYVNRKHKFKDLWLRVVVHILKDYRRADGPSINADKQNMVALALDQIDILPASKRPLQSFEPQFVQQSLIELAVDTYEPFFVRLLVAKKGIDLEERKRDRFGKNILDRVRDRYQGLCPDLQSSQCVALKQIISILEKASAASKTGGVDKSESKKLMTRCIDFLSLKRS